MKITWDFLANAVKKKSVKAKRIHIFGYVYMYEYKYLKSKYFWSLKENILIFKMSRK